MILAACALAALPQSVEEVAAFLEEVGLGPGAVVADVGTSNGSLASRFAEAVGPTGEVWMQDIGAHETQWLARATERPWMRSVRGVEDDPRLPEGRFDLVLSRDAVHEFTHVGPMLAGMRDALKPGGVLAVIDRFPGPIRERSAFARVFRRPAGPRHVRELDVGGRLALADLPRTGRVLLAALPPGDDGAETIRTWNGLPDRPPRALDAAVLVDAFHALWFEDLALRWIRRALPVGGALVVVDRVGPDGRRRNEDLVRRTPRAGGGSARRSSTTTGSRRGARRCSTRSSRSCSAGRRGAATARRPRARTSPRCRPPTRCSR